MFGRQLTMAKYLDPAAGAFVSSDRGTTVFWVACLVAGSLLLRPHS
ncbi:MAG: hypothetical protein WBC31_06310 [Candidatus Phosphoribacter baldrii]